MSSAAMSSSAPSAAATSALPSGITAPLEVISDTDRGALVAILAAFALSLILVSFPIRVYCRSKLSTYKTDDWAFFGASAFAILQAAGVFYELHRGFGKSGELIISDDIEPMQKAAYSSDLLYIVALFLSKCSTAFLFLRLTPGRGHSIAIWSTICVCISWAFISIILLAFRCHPQHPWLDIGSSACTSIFSRWQFIGALDIITELALFAISLYLVWGIQMSIKSKSIVVSAFACRLPVIAIAGLRLYYLQLEITTSNPTIIGGPEAVACAQIEIGYSILASIVPCLKNFMAPYDKPIMTQTGYQQYGSNRNYTHELSSIASKSDMKDDIAPTLASPSLEHVYLGHRLGDLKHDGEERVGGGKDDLPQPLGRLRPERINYEARVSHHADGDMEPGSRGEEGRSIDSGNSRRMIIKKGVEWSVNYDQRTSSP